MATHRTDLQDVDRKAKTTAQRAHGGNGAVADSAIQVREDEVGLQLQRILGSHPFRNSKRSIQFLSFVVENALAGNTSEIKERLIGIEVFDRRPDYDLTADPIVRGAAVEVRKRLAQYYAEPDHAGELRVELPLGTYIPVFHWPIPAHKSIEDQAKLEVPGSAVKSTTASAMPLECDANPRTKLLPTWWTRGPLAGLVLAASIGALLAAYSIVSQTAKRSLSAFWAPLMNEAGSITVCVGDLNYIFQAPPYNTLDTHTTTENLLNSNAGAALLRIGEILGSKGKSSTLRLADHTELSDLRQQPVILIGGMNNPWTQRILDPLRFRLTSKPGGINGNFLLLTDAKNLALTTWRVDLSAPPDSITRDYSLVTRMNDPLTGQPVVILCGLGPYGTAAASEFVSNPNYFSEFSKQAPKGWENRNIQIVLETTVVDRRVSVPRVVAEQVY